MTTSRTRTPPSQTDTQWQSISQIAKQCQINPSAVRFYESQGLITATRTSRNQRRFDTNAACRIKVAQLAQRVGLSVREIVDLFTPLPDDPAPEDWGRVTDKLMSEARRRVRDLEAQLDALASSDRLCDVADSSEPAPIQPP